MIRARAEAGRNIRTAAAAMLRQYHHGRVCAGVCPAAKKRRIENEDRIKGRFDKRISVINDGA